MDQRFSSALRARRVWTADFALAYQPLSTARVFWSLGKSQRSSAMAMAKVTSFSGEMGSHRNARYVP